MVAPKKNTERNAGKMQYGVSRIIPNGRRDSNSSDSYDESEVNRNRTQHSKKGGPQETDDRLAEPESLPPLEDVPTKQIPFEILKTQENSFESNVENAVTEKIETSKSLNNDFTIDFTNSPHPSSSDETDEDSERDEILKKTTSEKTKANPTTSEIQTLSLSEIKSIMKNSKSKTPEPSKKPGEGPSETVLQASKSSDLKTPEKDSSNHKNPQKPVQQDRTPSKPAAKSLTPKKILDDHLFNTDTADTESETGLRKEINSVVDRKLSSDKSPKNGKLKKKKAPGKPKTKESESGKEEESTSSARLLARTAARKGTHDPTKVTTTVRSKASTGKADSTDSDVSSDSEPVKTQVSSADACVAKWQSLNDPGSKTRAKTKTAVTKLAQTATKPASPEKKKDTFTSSSDSSSGELVIDETNNKTKEQKKTSPAKAATTKATTSKAAATKVATTKAADQTENKSISETKEDSSDSSSSDDEIFKKLKAKRSSSKACSAIGSTHNARPKSSSSDSDSDQFR